MRQGRIAAWSIRTVRRLAPLLTTMALALIVGNAAVACMDGVRMLHLTAIGGCVAALGCLAAVFLADRLPEPVRRVLGAGCLVVILLVGYLAVNVARAVPVCLSPAEEADVLLVLGNELRRDDSPSAMLVERLDRAAALYAAQREKPALLLSGGQMPSERVVEAVVMQDYLLAHGIPKEAILLEDASVDTTENMHNAIPMLRAHFPGARVMVVTSLPHLLRSKLLAERERMQVLTCGTGMPWAYWPNAVMHEYLGILMLDFWRNLSVLAAERLRQKSSILMLDFWRNLSVLAAAFLLALVW